LKFWGRAARPGTAAIAFDLQQSRAPNRVLASHPTIALTDQWQPYSFILVATGSETKAKLNVIVGHQAQTLWFGSLTAGGADQRAPR